MRPVLAGLLFVLACRDDHPQAPPPEPIAVRRDAGVVVDAPPPRFIGVLTAAESVEIAPRVAGVLKAVAVDVGDRVQAGQVVAEMDPNQLREEVRAAEAALAAASAALRSAGVDVADAKRKLAMEIKAVEGGVSPAQNIDQAKLDLQRAEAAVERARSNQAAESARVKTARDHLDDAGLRAPFAGIVAERYRDAGGRIEAGSPIVRIVGQGSMRLRFAVPPDRAKSLSPGGKVTATIDTVTSPVTATVKQIPPTIDPPSGMIIVEAELDTAGSNDLREGLDAWVKTD